MFTLPETSHDFSSWGGWAKYFSQFVTFTFSNLPEVYFFCWTFASVLLIYFKFCLVLGVTFLETETTFFWFSESSMFFLPWVSFLESGLCAPLTYVAYFSIFLPTPIDSTLESLTRFLVVFGNSFILSLLVNILVSIFRWFFIDYYELELFSGLFDS